jgi:alpha/beta superfamily hydrolase
MAEDRLEVAKNLLKMGKTVDARQVLEAFLKDDRNHIHAWYLYSEAWTNVEDKKRVWGYCLRFNPDSAEAKRALSVLNDTTNNQTQFVKRNKLPAPKKKTDIVFTMFSGCAGLLIVCVIGWTINFLISQPDDPSPYRHVQPVEYYLYVPDDYSSDHVWPLFVGIHGSGGSGLDCWNMWQTYAEKEGFILLCPTIPGDAGGYYSDVGERTVWGAVGEVQRDYRVSPRMFLAGFSAGAYFVQFFTSHYPDSVSGLAILSTGYYVEGFQPRMPILVAIGGADNRESLRKNEIFVNYMNQNGFDVEYHVLPGVGHWPSGKMKQLTIELFRETIGK